MEYLLISGIRGGKKETKGTYVNGILREMLSLRNGNKVLAQILGDELNNSLR